MSSSSLGMNRYLPDEESLPVGGIPSTFRRMRIVADLGRWIVREFWRAPNPSFLNEAEAQSFLRQVRSADDCDATLAALERFADLMLQEVQSRSAVLDTKALSILGWTSAASALFLSRAPSLASFNSWQVGLLAIGGIAAVLAAVFGFMAIRIRKFPWPSQADWFCASELLAPRRLRSYHLLSALEIHTAHARENLRKAYFVHLSQWGLGLTVICLTMGLLTGLIAGN